MEARLGFFLLLLVTVLQVVVESGYIGCYQDDRTRILPKAVLRENANSFVVKKDSSLQVLSMDTNAFVGMFYENAEKEKKEIVKRHAQAINVRHVVVHGGSLFIQFVHMGGNHIDPAVTSLVRQRQPGMTPRKCITKNSMLAEVVSYGERDFVRKQASKYAETFWLGGTDSKHEGSWIWATSQSNVIVTGWHTRLVKEPNNQGGNEHCINIHKKLDFEWNDDRCWNRYRYICEKLLV